MSFELASGKENVIEKSKTKINSFFFQKFVLLIKN